jgi:hypothetical protein
VVLVYLLVRTRFGVLRATAKRVNRIKDRDFFLRNRLLTACVFSLSSRSQAQEFVNVLNMVM